MQIYKIQALSCLMMAYCMSVLYLDGIKLGDQQVHKYLLPSSTKVRILTQLCGIKLGDQQVQKYLRPSTKVLASQYKSTNTDSAVLQTSQASMPTYADV
jgi:hypothetical protein